MHRNSSLFGNFRMFWPRFIDLQNFILLVRTVPFSEKCFFISSSRENNNYFLLYKLIQDLPYSLDWSLDQNGCNPHKTKYVSL